MFLSATCCEYVELGKFAPAVNSPTESALGKIEVALTGRRMEVESANGHDGLEN